MSAGNGAGPQISDQARKVVWRIFGVGESPLKGRSSYELIGPMVEHHVAVADRSAVMREIQGWFELHGERHGLRPEMQQQVSVAIMKEIRTKELPGAAVWAVGSIDVELAANLIRSNWSATAIDGFVHATLDALKEACDQNRVLDVKRVFGSQFDATDAKITKHAFAHKGALETFQKLVHQELGFVLGGLQPTVENLMDLSVTLRPDLLDCLIERLEHPVLQARAARCAIEAVRPSNHRATLDWIHADSCDALVALAIAHSLETVNALDDDLRYSGREEVVGHMWATELRPPCDDLDVATASLLAGLVDRLLQLRPSDSIRWIGELLATASGVLQTHGYDIPLRVQQLETACTDALVQLVHQSWSNDLPESLSTALRTTSRETWTRHLGDLAWALRESEPKPAVEIARVALHSHKAHVMQMLEHNRSMGDWRYWEHREWIKSLGICLAVSDRTLDLPKWVVARCQQLPLSIWDADVQRDYQTFNTAEQVARHWFLVAFHAIEPCKELGRRIAPEAVRFLAKKFYDHCHYAQPYVHNNPASSVTAEYAVRCAVEFGDASEGWLLELAGHPAAGARILWAMIDQCRRKFERVGDGGAGSRLYGMFVTELASIASDRFGDRRGHGLDDLENWGRLWLLLGKIDEAEETALALLAFPARLHTRARTILALKLLALAAGKRSLDPPIWDRFQSLYREYWSVFTHNEEQLDREHVDALLKGSPHGLLSIRSTH